MFDCHQWLSEGYKVAAVAAETPKGMIPQLLWKTGGGSAFQNCRGVARMVEVALAGAHWYGGCW